MPLTSKYLHEHASAVENYETIGRNISALILRTAAEKMESENLTETEAVELTMTVKLTQFKPMLCVKLEICTPLGCITQHTGLG